MNLEKHINKAKVFYKKHDIKIKVGLGLTSLVIINKLTQETPEWDYYKYAEDIYNDLSKEDGLKVGSYLIMKNLMEHNAFDIDNDVVLINSTSIIVAKGVSEILDEKLGTITNIII